MRTGGPRSWIVAGALAVAALAGAPAAHAAAPITDSFNVGSDGHCPVYGDMEICSGEVPSWDSAPLDVDLTKPTTSAGGNKHPLIVMLHGFGNNKHEWESTTDEGDGADKAQWNSHWFARHGYYVLTYTARGFKDRGPDRSDEPDTPSFSSESAPRGTIHIKSREFEIKDTQWLTALVADAFPDVDPNEIAVTGGSYGGGESWLQASQDQWTFPHDQDPSLPVLQLQAAIPKYPWTDLAYSLAPNGHPGFEGGDPVYSSSQCRPDDDVCAVPNGNPFGVGKLSWVTALSAVGHTDGTFEEGTAPGPEEGPYSTAEWQARSDVEPYDVPPPDTINQIRRGLTEFRSSYYQDEQWAAEQTAGHHEVAVFSISGWTDDLFPPVESFRQYKFLKSLDPLWPVTVAVGDVGHSRAQNRPETWRRFNNQAWQFLQANINGAHRQQTTVLSEQTVCDPGNAPAQQLTATTPEGLANGTLSVDYADGATLNSKSGLADPNGPATDALTGDAVEPGEPCRSDRGPALGGYTAESQPLSDHRILVGIPTVHMHIAFTGETGQIDARVWDVPPAGPALLVSRGTYRFSSPFYDTSPEDIRLPLYGNHWDFAPGHKIRLDLTQVDQPTYKPSNVDSTVTFDPPTLVLPTREAADTTITGAGVPTG